MNDAQTPLQKKLMGDGPAERQILLMKLVHEFDNAPNFGDEYVADASSEPQQWIARIGALLTRTGLGYKLAFERKKVLSAHFWEPTRESMRQELSAAAEEIRLELELDAHDDIGKVYEAKQQYDFLRDLKGIILSAKDEVFVVDPYFDGAAFNTYLSELGSNHMIRVLCWKYAADVAGHVKTFSDQHGVSPEIRQTNKIHDRLVILDGSECWIVGGSIKDAGNKPTYLVPLNPGIAPTKVSIYEDLWKQSQTV